jgi:hypothetical protein
MFLVSSSDAPLSSFKPGQINQKTYPLPAWIPAAEERERVPFLAIAFAALRDAVTSMVQQQSS